MIITVEYLYNRSIALLMTIGLASVALKRKGLTRPYNIKMDNMRKRLQIDAKHDEVK